MRRTRDVLNRAAVLVPLLSIDGDVCVVFIERSHSVPTHRGDIAFPGGRYQPERDAGLLATALREAEEEIGVQATDVQLIRVLPDVRTLISKFIITPFVGQIAAPYVFTPNPGEVAAVLTVPLTELRQPGRRRTIRRRLGGGADVEVPAFVIGTHVIWGVTQRITEELLQALP